ncbi:MAG: hypothetical protein AB7U73_11900 [Pirellulales bacterium]
MPAEADPRLGPRLLLAPTLAPTLVRGLTLPCRAEKLEPPLAPGPPRLDPRERPAAAPEFKLPRLPPRYWPL